MLLRSCMVCTIVVRPKRDESGDPLGELLGCSWARRAAGMMPWTVVGPERETSVRARAPMRPVVPPP